ncbi:MAG: GNAT superfamily N-acetyltransferase [Candidatus Azotimanducaceae bacterium]|jgi:GNAT superfamily N-acetyltransferase
MPLELEKSLTEQEVQYLRNRLDESNSAFAGPRNSSEFGFAFRDDTGQVLAGLGGSSIWEWLLINFIWVSDELRGQGYGSKLLLAAEVEGLT